jgi:hypothetical protein
MPALNFGQPQAGVFQMAYVVEDIQEGMRRWIDQLGVGPWFLLDTFSGVDPSYRGAPSEAEVSLAMSFAGHMLVELIALKDDRPSVGARASSGSVTASITSASARPTMTARSRATSNRGTRSCSSARCPPAGASATSIRPAS